ncbi:hypothetical protein [Mesorhizobium sp. GbtcB19]|uniref:hypothetical protein n=1 Tax=Mesorhizobium sp. GbtcB19 TaxID=2824764 RepID=UPI001C30F6C1|nr:hypothetical protein [Mesorhizobium sp. GbtcB19]
MAQPKTGRAGGGGRNETQNLPAIPAIRSSDFPEQPIQSALAGGNGMSIPIRRTAPDALLRHDISDEELTMLRSENSRPFEKDVLWAAIGASCGALAPALQAMHGLYTSSPNFGFWDLAECAIFFAGFVVACLMGMLISRKPTVSGPDELARAIRERTSKSGG